jgi:hypothetical protein
VEEEPFMEKYCGACGRRLYGSDQYCDGCGVSTAVATAAVVSAKWVPAPRLQFRSAGRLGVCALLTGVVGSLAAVAIEAPSEVWIEVVTVLAITGIVLTIAMFRLGKWEKNPEIEVESRTTGLVFLWLLMAAPLLIFIAMAWGFHISGEELLAGHPPEAEVLTPLDLLHITDRLTVETVVKGTDPLVVDLTVTNPTKYSLAMVSVDCQVFDDNGTVVEHDILTPTDILPPLSQVVLTGLTPSELVGDPTLRSRPRSCKPTDVSLR